MTSAEALGGLEAFQLWSVPWHLTPLEVCHFVQHSAQALSSLSSDAGEHAGLFVACFLKPLVIAA